AAQQPLGFSGLLRSPTRDKPARHDSLSFPTGLGPTSNVAVEHGLRGGWRQPAMRLAAQKKTQTEVWVFLLPRQDQSSR
ncbi:hypothetical protein, partial [Pseudomonas sp. SWRI51]|uniref:hypothetical protein n=1 Tax=Pseudomonas sp. SWRI51 TaxID=2745491 RepID=UPI001EE39D40